MDPQKIIDEFITVHKDNESREKYRYLEICPTLSSPYLQAGINDVTYQTGVYILLAKILGLTLILPLAKLEKIHNNDRYVDLIWSDYYDLNNITVDSERVTVVENAYQNFQGQTKCKKRFSLRSVKSKILYEYCKSKGVLKIEPLRRPKDSNDGKHFDPFAEISRLVGTKFSFPACKNDVKLAKKLMNRYSFEGCVHIRRTDRCIAGSGAHGVSGQEWDEGTQAKNILAFLNKTSAPRNLYIMTDMNSDDENIQKLKNDKNYNMTFMHDVPELIPIKIENNYKVFNIEKCIFNLTKYHRSSLRMVEFSKGEIPWLTKK